MVSQSQIHIEGDRVAGVSYALYRVPAIVRITNSYDSKEILMMRTNSLCNMDSTNQHLIICHTN